MTGDRRPKQAIKYVPKTKRKKDRLNIIWRRGREKAMIDKAITENGQADRERW